MGGPGRLGGARRGQPALRTDPVERTGTPATGSPRRRRAGWPKAGGLDGQHGPHAGVHLPPGGARDLAQGKDGRHRGQREHRPGGVVGGDAVRGGGERGRGCSRGGRRADGRRRGRASPQTTRQADRPLAGRRGRLAKAGPGGDAAAAARHGRGGARRRFPAPRGHGQLRWRGERGPGGHPARDRARRGRGVSALVR